MGRQLLVGLPSTGKTTFVAALWHVIESGEVQTSLDLSRPDENLKYLNEIRDQWLGAEELERTKGSKPNRVHFEAVDKDSGATTTIDLPDIAGETYKSHVTDRRWGRAFAKATKDATGVLIFIHPEEVREPNMIQETYDEDFGGPSSPGSTPASTGDELREGGEPQSDDVQWDMEEAPTHVQMVELLQFLDNQLECVRPFPVCVVISAWDLVESATLPGKNAPKPVDWLEENLPLLHQYLRANPERFTTRVYGVSALGGSLENDRDTLRSKLNQSERVKVRRGDKETHDITAPLKWSMKQVQKEQAAAKK